MRPVDKKGAPRVYADYRDAADDLSAAIGDYCSYCERQIETHLAVEHIQPKSLRPSLRNVWTNFLLGCVNCNSCKGKRRINLDKFFWPDRHNTMLAFDYVADGRVAPHPGLNGPDHQRAQRAIELVGLDREPGHLNIRKRPKRTDRRWRRRQEAWDLAQRDLARLTINNSPEVRDLIVENALGRGLFSIWMKVFETDIDMRKRLINAFKGTATGCFDPVSSACVCRNGVGI